jgi:hypothetical protein
MRRKGLKMDRRFMTVVIRMPEDPEKRAATAKQFMIGADCGNGGIVTAAGIGDEMSRIEKYEEKYGDIEDA